MNISSRKNDLYAIDLSDAVWRKSSYSNGAEQCVEITDLPGGGIAVRDSKNPGFPALRYSTDEWAAFRKVISGAM